MAAEIREVSMASGAPKFSLPEEQVAEIKKVFSVFDKDGDGTINGSELGEVIRRLAGGTHLPTEAEREQLMAKMDANRDGVISWDEFLSALAGWLKDEDDGKSERRHGTKRKGGPASPSETRAKIHRQITGFFNQFRRHADFDSLRDKYISLARRAQDGEVRGGQGEGPDLTQSTAQEKVEALNKANELLPHIASMAVGINGNNPPYAMECVKGIANILKVCDVFQTPEERYDIGELIISMFQRIQEASVIPRIINFLTVEKMPELQYEACRVLTYFCGGPRVAHTPRDSILHPDKMWHKSNLIEGGAVHNLIRLVESNCVEVREQSIVCLGKLASHDAPVRDLCLNMGLYPLLFNQINDATSLSLLTKLTWTLSILCGHTHSVPVPKDKYNIIGAALPKFAYLFQGKEERVLIHVVTALSYLLPGIVVDESISTRLIQLLQSPSLRLQQITIGVIADIASLSSDGSIQLIKSGLLPILRELLSRSTTNSSVRLDVVDLIATLVGNERPHTQDVLDGGIIPAFVTLLASDESARPRVLKVLILLTRSSPPHVAFLVEGQEIVKHLANALVHFKSYDSVLRDTYGFAGAAFNFDFVYDIISGLINILKTGELAPSGNPFVRYYGMEVIDKVKDVMEALASKAADQMDAWRNTSESGGQGTLEELLVNFFAIIKTVHEKSRGPSSQMIIEAINNNVRDFQITLRNNRAEVEKKRAVKKRETGAVAVPGANGMTMLSSTAFGERKGFPGANVTIKCFTSNGDNRVLEAPRDITLKELSLRIQLKYGRSYILQYEDEERDKITIDSADLLTRALSRADAQGYIRILLLPPAAAVATSSWAGAGALGSMDGTSGLFAGLAETKRAIINEISYESKLSKSDLERLYNQFQRTSSGGFLTKDQFAHGFKEITGSADPDMIDQFFNAFDYDKDGKVDFRDFACGLGVLHKGSAEERLLLCFKAYDLDGNNSIDRDELFLILKSSFRAKGFIQSDEFIRTLVNQCFEKADINGDGVLDFEEFKSAVLQHQIVVQSFWKPG